MPTLNLGKEPVAIIGTVQAVLIALQQLTLPVSSGVHAAIAAVIVVLGVVLARSGVTPVAASKPKRIRRRRRRAVPPAA